MIKWTAGTIYIAGAETTVSMVHTFFMCMTMFPEIRKRAREELDCVVGLDRLPKISDRDKLPYMQAVVLEALRWAAPAPSGVAHRLREDDVHRGYFIPKDSIIIPNILQFSRDPNVYTDPSDFRPERFLGPKPEQDPRTYVFGFGRRVCPGQQLAEASVFSACATALATLDIDKALDSNGVPIEIKPQYHGRSVRIPDDFPCDIKSRSPQAQRLLQAEVETHWH
jgi:cytochrome P450